MEELKSEWLSVDKCVAFFMDYAVIGRYGKHPTILMREVKYVSEKCRCNMIRIKRRGSKYWIHISKRLANTDQSVLVLRLRGLGFRRACAQKSKWIMSCSNPTLDPMRDRDYDRTLMGRASLQGQSGGTDQSP